MPSKTQAYVRIVTGRRADEWRPQGTPATLNVTAPADMACAKIAVKFPAPSKEVLDKPTFPWGVQLIGDLSEVKALAAYRALQKKHEAILGSYQPRVIRTTTVKMKRRPDLDTHSHRGRKPPGCGSALLSVTRGRRNLPCAAQLRRV